MTRWSFQLMSGRFRSPLIQMMPLMFTESKVFKISSIWCSLVVYGVLYKDPTTSGSSFLFLLFVLHLNEGCFCCGRMLDFMCGQDGFCGDKNSSIFFRPVPTIDVVCVCRWDLPQNYHITDLNSSSLFASCIKGTGPELLWKCLCQLSISEM